MSEGATIEPTGRELREPTGRLLELSDGSATYTAIEYDASYADHPALNVGIELIDSFMAHPMVIGLAELLNRSRQPLRFTFATGEVWTIRELLRQYRDIGKPMGVRAGVELAYLSWQILQEASENGAPEGCYSHGNLSPWRLALRRDGTVQVFGFGIPAVDWLAHLDDPKRILDADTVRYSPPERLTDGPEDGSADAFSLAVIIWEVITGEPLLSDHDPKLLRQRISNGEATALLSKRTKGIPKHVSEVLARMTIYDPDTRLSGAELNRELKALLDKKLTGSSLADIMTRIRGSAPKKRRSRKVAEKVETGMFTREQLSDMVDDGPEDEAGDPAKAEETRWGKVKRDEEEAPAEAPPKKRRQRTRTADATPAETSAAKAEAPAEEAPKRRRRRSAKAETEAPAAETSAAKAEAPAEEAPKPRRRRRKAADSSEADAADSKKEAPKPTRKRRRSAAAEDKEPSEEPAEEAPKRRRRRRTES